jgi:enamine deaminase RidA (YjgF/YER057c/UK114 family)
MPAANIRPTSRKAIVPPGWQQFYDETGVSAAIRHGDMLYVTGHTGEDDDLTFSADLEHQIRRTFINLALTLAEAGTDWSDVVEIVSYHVGLREQADALTRISREFLAPPSPAWSAVGVAELWDEGAVIEMSCVAAIGGPNGSPP